jgi:hypothetical protein
VQLAVEEAAHRAGSLGPPAIDGVTVGVYVQRLDHGGEALALVPQQLVAAEPGAPAEGQLEQQLGTDVAQVVDGTIQPRCDGSSPGRRRPQQRPLASPAPRGTAARHQPALDQLFDRPVRQRPRQRPDAAELTVWRQQRADRPPMLHTLGDERQARVAGEIEAVGGRRHNLTIVDNSCSDVLLVRFELLCDHASPRHPVTTAARRPVDRDEHPRDG